MINFESDVFCKRASELFGDLSQMELAEKIGISQGVISSIKNGKAKAPAADTIFRIARYFNVSADYILGLSDVASVDADLQAVCNYTGLSEEAAMCLYDNNVYMHHNIDDAIELLLLRHDDKKGLDFFAEISDLKWEIQELNKARNKAEEFVNEKSRSLHLLEGIAKIDFPLLIVGDYGVETNEQKETRNKFNSLMMEISRLEERRDLCLFRMSKILQEIAAELEREGSSPSENT